MPELSLLGSPRLGTTAWARLGNSGAATASFLLIGFQPSSVPLFGGTLLVVPTAVKSALIGWPTTTISIPNWPSLVGSSIYLQAVELDAGASNGFAFSRGLEMRVGM